MLKAQHHPQSSQKSKKKCKQKQMINIQKSIYKQFKTRNSHNKEFYNLQISNQIISNETAHIVALFKDYLILDDISEFLQRYYKIAESKEKLPKIYEYYESCSVIFPNYVILYEAKYICKNIQRKQRLIDHQQQYEEEEERRKHELNSLDSSVETVFNTKTFDSLCNITGSNSIILRAVGDHYVSKKTEKIDNGNNANLNIVDQSEESSRDESAERVLDRIQKSEWQVQKQKEVLEIKRKKNYNTMSIDTEASPIKKSQHFFINNILTSTINSSIEKKAQKIKINLKTESNIIPRKHKTKINIIGLTQGNGIKKKDVYHKNTLSMPKLTTRIFHVVNKRIYSINTTNQIASQGKAKFSSITNKNTNATNSNSNNNFISLTSRDSDIKPKLNIKTDLYEMISNKCKDINSTLHKPIVNMAKGTPHLTLKAQENNSNKHQKHSNSNQYLQNVQRPHPQHLTLPQKTHSKSGKGLSSTISHQKKDYDNLYDKYQKKSNPISDRNKRNLVTNKETYGLFSYDFLTTPIVELVKTSRQTTLSNEFEKRKEKIAKNFCIKGFEEMIKKKENGMGVSNSQREKEKEIKPNGMITNVKIKKIKDTKYKILNPQ